MFVSLRHGTAHAALGADEDLEFVITKIRQRWPGVDIEVRADSRFGVPAMYEICERLNVWYTFGIGLNSRSKAESAELPLQAEERCKQTGEKQWLFSAIPYQAKGWNRARSVIIKAECHAVGTNRRAVMTNLHGALTQSHLDSISDKVVEFRRITLQCDRYGIPLLKECLCCPATLNSNHKMPRVAIIGVLS